MSALAQLFSYQFMVNAFVAGTIVSVMAGLMGWFMVLRRQTFAGHAVAVVGFPGAAGAALVGLDVAWGYFGFCVLAALVIALVPGASANTRAEESALTGVVQTFALACGFLFASLYAGNLSGVNSLLFGSFLGITAQEVWVLLAVAVAGVSALAAMGRPLLFASVDREVASASGVPVKWLSAAFLLLLGVTVAGAVQITGTLLVFGLLVAPAAAAQAITPRPAAGLALSVVFALGITWSALVMAFWWPYPLGFFVTTIAFAVYVLARAAGAARNRGRTRTRTHSTSGATA